MKKWIQSTVILASSLCLPLSLTGTEILDWGIMGVGGESDFKEQEESLKIAPLMTAAARIIAANQVDQVTYVTEGGIIQPVIDSGAEFESILVNGNSTETIDFPSNGSPAAYVTQSVPANFDSGKGATVIFTFITTSSLTPITGNALFSITLTHGNTSKTSNPQPIKFISTAAPVTEGNAPVNTYTLTFRLPKQTTRGIALSNVPLTFKLSRINLLGGDNFASDLYLTTFEVIYSKKAVLGARM